MEYSEKYGMDVDEAVRLALDELGLREDQVMVTVLEESNKGFLGLGQKLAKVRVEKIEDDTIDEFEELSQADVLAAAERPQPKAMHDFRKKNRQQTQSQASESRHQERPQSGSGGKDSRRSSGSGSGGSGKRDRGGTGKGQGQGQSQGQGQGQGQGRQGIDIDLSSIKRVSESIENLVPDPDSEPAKFLVGIISKMGLDVQIEGFKNDECSFIEIKGQDSRVVIGKRGQTLDALQYLTNLVSNKGAEEYRRVIIDVEGYRYRREKTLEQLAVKLAKKVISTGRNARLEPMNPYERKVIHATLQNVDGINTKSEGEEPYRRVIIEKK